MSRPPSLVDTTIVQAGAGTGKTESLAQRIIAVAEIIHEQKKGRLRFVATTFTERATSELRERVVSHLSKKSEASPWLVDFVQDSEQLHISTIHGTLSLILHRFGHLLGLDPEFTILSQSEERDLLSRTLRSVLAETPSLGMLLYYYSFSELIGLVRDLIPHGRLHGEAFKVADGWAATLERDREQLIESLETLKNADLSALTANQAEKLSQIGGILEPLRKLGQDHANVRKLFLEFFEEFRKPVIKANGKGSELKPALDFIFDLKNDRWGSESFDPRINVRHEEVAQYLQELVNSSSSAVQDLKRQEGFLTFDDLEFLTLELIEKHPEVLTTIRTEWDFWFVDEFQDTSPLQKKLLFHFFRDPWNAYFVGDPQQSIYLFRGADESVFQSTKALVEKIGGRLERLKTNYRSDPDLLHFMNDLFTKMKTPMEALEARAQRKGEIRGQIYLANDKKQESPLIFNQILEWQRLGHAFHDMAILVRTNDKAQLVARYLGGMGVPVYVHATGGYYDRREVLDALGLLSFLEDPSDDETFILIARSPWVGIPDEILATWGAKRKKISYWDWLKENPEVLESFRTLQILRDAIIEAETRPLSTVFEKLVAHLGFLEFCLVGDASGRREANLRKMFFTLREAESQPGFSAAKYVDAAWRELTEAGEETEAASFIEPQRVNIMTIHKSKGLKFNCVIVPNCGDPLRPKSNFLELAPDGRFAVRVLDIESEEKISSIVHGELRDERFKRELAEFQRVFYVAVTRAAERVCLIGQQDFQENSWFSSLGSDLSEGDHDGYSVKLWNEEPVLNKIEVIDDLDMARVLKPAAILSRLSNRMTVTQLVQHRFKVNEFDAMKKIAPGILFQSQVEFQQRGYAIHYIFDEIKKNPEIPVTQLCEMARKRFVARLKIDPSYISRTLAITDPPLKKIIESGFTEWSFNIRQDDFFLEGQIDLWGEVDGLTWIVDYKSAEVFNDYALKKAKEQLELYALAVHKTGKSWDQIRLAVVAPLLAKIEPMTLSPMSEVLKRIQPLKIDDWGETEI